MQAVRRRQARELAEAASLLWVGSDFVGAVGADQHDVFVDEVAGEEVEQVPRQRVGPVQILERDDDRSVSAEAGDELEQRREQRAGRRPCDRRTLRDPVAQRRERRLAVSASGCVRRTLRSRSASGASGISSPPIGTHRPTISSAPARRAPSVTSVDLPMPASPPTSSTAGAPSRAAATARSKAASSSLRPTKSAVEDGSGTGAQYRRPSVGI